MTMFLRTREATVDCVKWSGQHKPKALIKYVTTRIAKLDYVSCPPVIESKFKGIPDYVSTREASHSDGQPTEAHDDLRLCLEGHKLYPARIMIEGLGFRV